VKSLLDYLDSASDLDVQKAVALSRIDRIRMARLQTFRALVWTRLHELGHYEIRNHQVTIPAYDALSSTAFDNLKNTTVTVSAFAPDMFEPVPEDWSQFVFERLLIIPGPDPLVINERKALRRVLRLLNKVITIALRREALHDSLRHLVLRLQAFFVTHGNHPPHELVRHRLMPEGGAV
jgi:hypothetical protein